MVLQGLTTLVSSGSIVTRLRVGLPGQSFCIFFTVSTPEVVLIQPPTQWIGLSEDYFQRAWASHSPQSSAEVKDVCSCTCIPPHSVALCLIEHGDNFAVTFLQLMRILRGMVTNKLILKMHGSTKMYAFIGLRFICFCTHKMQHRKLNIEYDIFSILAQ
jgi:hypothetical protein